ncbi:MAG: 5-(carboxyamino)imidazole ribonucleotide synthase [Rickettsiaceae bacterium H1]|nr:5-(carboxyamino)imidazole ribonucleotide synthase [Rickettsiaceae bacterium H1]
MINYPNLIKKKLGILGGGQLGRMLAIAAHSLGIEVIIFTDIKNSPASYVTNKTIVAAYDDGYALSKFADNVDYVTTEFENIPCDSLEFLAKNTQVYPDSTVLQIIQDRLTEKQFVNDLGLPTTRFEQVGKFEDITLNYPFIIKTRRMGYDGKGQYLIRSINDKIDVNFSAIAEKVVDFYKEISIITVRDSQGNIEFFPIAENFHKDGILRTSSVPADISNDIRIKAKEIGAKISTKLNYVGVITMELFLTKDGELLVNEIAPRVHNSGHWSIETCNVSQFEQHVRAVCGLPIKPVKLYFSCEMHNLIGDDITKINLNSPGKRLTVYGKKEVKNGRKMGHIIILKS